MSSTQELLISADSHVVEDSNLWEKRLPANLRDRAPRYAPRAKFQTQESGFQQGGWDPVARIREMAVDGVSGEVLYPTLALNQFGIKDAVLQEACFRVYNDWLIEYCATSPERLFGVALISTYRIDEAIKEMERCKRAGIRGIEIWQVPPAEMSFATDFYDRFWAAAQEMNLPVSLHILTGAPYTSSERSSFKSLVEHLGRAVNEKLAHAASTLLDIVGSGVFERFSGAKVVLVENEVSWMPFLIASWDRYAKRKSVQSPLKMLPGEYARRQVFATFFNDPPSRWIFEEWGADNCMWSNDFPHPNSTWPHSHEVIARDLGQLTPETRAKLMHANVRKLYDLPAVQPLAAPDAMPVPA